MAAARPYFEGDFRESLVPPPPPAIPRPVWACSKHLFAEFIIQNFRGRFLFLDALDFDRVENMFSPLCKAGIRG